jgi:hypothetical protein
MEIDLEQWRRHAAAVAEAAGRVDDGGNEDVSGEAGPVQGP